MMKKSTVITLLAALGMCLAACGPKYDDEADFRVGPSQDGDKSVEITEYAGNKQIINIPPRLQKMPVTAIGQYAFMDKEINSVTIPRSVTTIGYFAFGRNQLTSITIPDSVTTIGNSAFSGNQLTSITIPDSVTTIGNSAFENNLLTTITIGANVDIGVGGLLSSYNPFYYSFPKSYEQNNKKAGTYVLNGADSTWSLQ